MRPTSEDLDAAIAGIRAAPKSAGTIELITVRPSYGTREVLAHATFSCERGLVGDSWHARPNLKGGGPDLEQQITLMGARAIAAIVPERVDWAGAGDQLFVDLDLSKENCPPGTLLAVGTAVLRVTAHPHLGCAKFTKRFGSAVTRWVNSDVGRALNLRGVNAQVVVPGEARPGDAIAKR